uniref:FZ domain-containing protein n=1 Tax=Strigops habroptila TaxID=2489341 RepID=A0A672VFR8_STRHB
EEGLAGPLLLGAGLASFLPGLMPPAGHCQPIPSQLPFCSVLGTSHFALPNYLRHSTEVEVQAALHEWEGLLESRCHRYLEWFLCLLLLPGCSASVPITPPPCQGFCEAIRDLCWMHLAGGRLPLPCDALPAEDEGYSCVFINASAGNALGDASALSPWDAAEPNTTFHPASPNEELQWVLFPSTRLSITIPSSCFNPPSLMRHIERQYPGGPGQEMLPDGIVLALGARFAGVSCRCLLWEQGERKRVGGGQHWSDREGAHCSPHQ